MKQFKTLAERQIEYEKEMGIYKPERKKADKPKTFNELSLNERNQLYTEFGDKTYHFYRANSHLKVVELVNGKEQELSADEIKRQLQIQGEALEKERKELEIEMLRLQVEKMRSELEDNGWL